MLRRASSHIAPVLHLNKSGVSHRDSDYKLSWNFLYW